MSRRRTDPLRALTDDERRPLTRLSRSTAAPAVHVARAVMRLAVSGGSDYPRAARTAGRRSGDAVSHLVARFNREGVAALDPRHGGGRTPAYDATSRGRIRREAARTPTPDTGRGGDDRPEHGPAPVGEAGTDRHPGRGAGPAADGRRVAGGVGPVAVGLGHADHPAGGTAPAAGAVGPGQPGRAPDPGVRPVAVRARGDAPVHSPGWVVAEHGREYSAGAQAAGVGRPTPGESG
jgi:hypothetical protein